MNWKGKQGIIWKTGHYMQRQLMEALWILQAKLLFSKNERIAHQDTKLVTWKCRYQKENGRQTEGSRGNCANTHTFSAYKHCVHVEWWTHSGYLYFLCRKKSTKIYICLDSVATFNLIVTLGNTKVNSTIIFCIISNKHWRKYWKYNGV